MDNTAETRCGGLQYSVIEEHNIVREKLVRHSASYTVTTMKKTLCERGVIQRNTLRRDVWDEMNRVELVHCASERLGRSNTDVNNTV